MADLNRSNRFATKLASTGKMHHVDYYDACRIFKEGGELYERVMPACSTTAAERALIPWTPVINPDLKESADG